MNPRAWLLLLALLLAGSTALAVLERSVAPGRDAQRAHVREAAYAAAVFGAAAPPPGLRYERATARGYAGDIELLLAIDARGCIRGVAAQRHQESSGYGAPLLGRQAMQAGADGWLRQVLASCGNRLPGTRLDGTTGATITANAVAGAIAQAARARAVGPVASDHVNARNRGQP